MTDKERKAWLDGLMAEEVVAIKSGGYDRTYRLSAIDKVTATQIVVGKYRYRKSDGRAMGGNYSPYSGREEIVPVTDEVREKLDRAQFASAFYDYRKLSQELPITTVRRILAVLKEANEEGKESKQ